MYKILLVEDEVKLRVELKKFLEYNGYQVFAIEEFNDVVGQINRSNVDLILLDLNLPGIDGHTICKEVRKQNETPIIVVTSKNTEIDELISINYGADDFIIKPYNSQILLARIARIFRRNTRSEQINYNHLTVDNTKSLIYSGEKTIELSKNEIKILSYLLRNRGSIASRDMLIDYLWQNDQFVDDNTLTVNINRVRNKLKEFGEDNVIETRRGQGYIII